MQQLLLSVLGLFLATALAAQCGGSLGENIFTDGDFGSGTENIVQEDRRLAPGFIYTTVTPPGDGYYTITNSTARWGFIYNTWLQVGDNSSDPNGYMMVVNSSLSPGKFYEEEVTGLCEDTDYQFSADVLNILRNTRPGIFPDVSFLLDDEVQFTTGNVPQDERWHGYSFSFRTAPGQTSIKLSLRNNAPGGDGNDLALDNISFRACGPETRVLRLREIVGNCEEAALVLEADVIGSQFQTPALQWQVSATGDDGWRDIDGARGESLRAADVTTGTRFYRYLLAASEANLANAKCRIVSESQSVTKQARDYERTDTICRGLRYELGPDSFGESGLYQATLTSSFGCDSNVSVALTVVEDTDVRAFVSATDPSCFGLTDGGITVDSFTGGAPPYTFQLDTFTPSGRFENLAGGTYRYTLTDRFLCADAGAIDLVEPAPFLVNLGQDQNVRLGETARVPVNRSAEIAVLTVDPPELGCDPGCPELTLLPTNSLLLRVVAQNERGCVASDSVFLNVVKERDVYLPNSFTPNDDGVNDRFVPFSDARRVAAVLYLRVYDRWGGLVFEGRNLPINDQRAGWDGTNNGREAPNGTYSYVTEIAYIDGESRRFAGSLHLIR